MSEMVSTFLDVSLGKGKYLFFLVAWNEYNSRIKEQLDKQFHPFGEDLGSDGTIIKAYDQKKYKTYTEIRGLSWPKDIKERMASEQDPFMLIINTDFEKFNPTENKWSIMWFSDFSKEPEMIYRIFSSLAKKVKIGDDVFEWAGSLSKKTKYNKLARYFQFKPGIFGVAFDAKLALEDLAGASS